MRMAICSADGVARSVYAINEYTDQYNPLLGDYLSV